MLKRIEYKLLFGLALMLLLAALCALPAHAATVVASGKCGTNVTWSLTDTGVLTISGTGAMDDYLEVEYDDGDYYYEHLSRPWRSYETTIQRIVVNEGVTVIGSDAFYNFTALESVSLPSTLTTIRLSVFDGCTNLSAVAIPSGVTMIGSFAFRDCTSLGAVTIPSSVTSIGESAFNGCTSLSSAVISPGVIRIYSYAFQGCTSLTSITIPDDVTTIGNYAFSGCTGLRSASVPDSVVNLNSSVFLGCTNLPADMVIARGTCGNNGNVLWSYVSGTKTLTISGTGDMQQYYDKVIDHGNVFYLSRNTPWYNVRKEIRQVIVESGVTSIGGGAFCTCTNLQAVQIPSTVTLIGPIAFYYCSSLQSIDLPTSLTEIGAEAFNYAGLTEVTLPEGLSTLGESAFADCRQLTSVSFPSSLTGINSKAFQSCSGLEAVTIPATITGIGSKAFYHCSSLASISFDTSTAHSLYVAGDAFAGVAVTELQLGLRHAREKADAPFGELLTVSQLQSMYYPGHVGDMYYSEYGGYVYVPYAVGYCGDPSVNGGKDLLWDFNPASGMIRITGSGNMDNYTTGPRNPVPWSSYGSQIVSLEVDPGVTALGQNAFYHCTDLATVRFRHAEKGRVIALNGAFSNCRHIASVDEGMTQASTAEGAATGSLVTASSLNSPYGQYLYVPGLSGYMNNGLIWSFDPASGTLTITGSGQMYYYPRPPWYAYISELRSVIIGEGVQNVYDYAFTNATKLQSVSLPSTTAYIGIEAFDGCAALTSLLIPAETLRIYERAFRNCTSLEAVHFQKTAVARTVMLYKGAFYGAPLSELDEGPTWADSESGAPNGADLTAAAMQRSELTLTYIYVPAFSVTLQGEPDCVYNGSPWRPAVTVSYGSLILTVNTDYVLSYQNNTAAGKAKVTAFGQGDYAGVTAQAEFSIGKAPLTLAVTLQGWTYGGTANSPSLTGNAGQGAVTYTYSADGENWSNTKPSDAGAYTVKATVVETVNYQSGEASAEFTIAQKSQDAPAGVGSTGETVFGKADGAITGVDETMEYKREEEETFLPISGTTVTGLQAGDYLVRYRSTQNLKESDTVSVTVASGEKITVVWCNDDGTELQSSEVAYGETPVYTGETPVKASTELYGYTFDKWTPAVTAVTEATTYTATYTQRLLDTAVIRSVVNTEVGGAAACSATIYCNPGTQHYAVAARYGADDRFLSLETMELTPGEDIVFTVPWGDAARVRFFVLKTGSSAPACASADAPALP